MQSFVLRENIAIFRQRLAEERDLAVVNTLSRLLAAAERQLALVEAANRGAGGVPRIVGTGRADLPVCELATIRNLFEASRQPYLIVDPRPGLHIVDINDSYAGVTMTERLRVAGERLFDVFPDNPDDVAADGVSKLFASLQTVAETGRLHRMELQRYDVRDVGGRFVVKYWQPVNSPILDRRGNLVFILHHVEDVTEAVLAASEPPQRAVAGG